MGGLARKIPITFVTFAVATAAIAGIPPLAGFFSKDEILWFAFASSRGGSPLLYAVAAGTALLTAFYMFRLLWLTFFGAPRMSARNRASCPRVAAVDDRRADRAGGAVGDRRLLLDCRTISSRCCRCRKRARARAPRDAARVRVGRAGARRARRRRAPVRRQRRAGRSAAPPFSGAAPRALRQVLRRRSLRASDRAAAVSGFPIASSCASATASSSTARCNGIAALGQRTAGVLGARAERQPAPLRVAGARRHRRLARDGAGAMAEAALLNVVLFLPLLGVAALLAVPPQQRQRCAPAVAGRHARCSSRRRMALRALRRGGGRPAVRDAAAVDSGVGRVLPDRSRRLQPAAGPADGVPRAAGRRRRVHGHPRRTSSSSTRWCSSSSSRCSGHLRRAGPVPVLPVLGGDDDPDVPHHRHLGRRAPHLRDAQVRALHGVRQHPDARRGHLSRVFAQRDVGRDVVCVRRPLSRGAAARRCRRPARRVRAVVRDQGADRAAAHVAARRARRSADRGLGDPGRRAAEDGNVRLHEARLPAVSRRDARCSRRSSGAGGRQHHLRRLPRAGADRHQEDHRLLVDQPPRAT